MSTPTRLAGPLVALLLLVATPLAEAAQSQAYDMPSSVAIRGVFGFGVLMCATSAVPQSVANAVRNGPCFSFAGHEGEEFELSADDTFWADTSVTAAVDVNGDGCISESCSGQPNTADDLRISNCGAVFDVLPTPASGVPRIVQTYLRGLDVTEDLRICGATSGEALLEFY